MAGCDTATSIYVMNCVRRGAASPPLLTLWALNRSRWGRADGASSMCAARSGGLGRVRPGICFSGGSAASPGSDWAMCSKGSAL